MDKNEKELLDSYRQERKERIAKQSKNSSKKSNSHSKGKAVLAKIAKAAVAVVIVVAIVAATLNFFGVPQRLIKSVEIDGENYSMSELSCYYMQVYNYYSSYSYYYDSNYGEGYGAMFTGYDYTISPSEQTKKSEDGETTITWDEFFLDEAISQMASIKRYYKLALEANIELTEDAQAEIQESIDSIQDQIDSYSSSATNAASANYSVSRFLTLTYGKGITESFYKKILTEQKYVELYQEARQKELEKNYTSEKIEAEYNKDTTDYDVVSFRWYTINIVDSDSGKSATDEQIATAKQSAQAFIDAVKSQANYNEETFKKVVLDTADKKDENYDTYKQDNATLLQKAAKSTISSNISDDAAKWLFEKNSDGKYVRQIGEMKYFVDKDKETVYILYATGVPSRDETKPTSVRHILVKFPEAKKTAETVSGEAVTGEEETNVDTATSTTEVSQADKDSCLKDAEKILKEYKDYIAKNFEGKADEDYFVELVKEHSDDSGSVSEGGLIEDMKNDGSYVTAFEDWAFSEGEFKNETRKAGDTAIIETEYGYHIMYYVGQDENAEWYSSILHELVDADWEKEQEEFEKTFAADSIQQNDTIVGWVKDACLDMIG